MAESAPQKVTNATRRGIQNTRIKTAVGRSEERAEGRLLQTKLRRKNAFAANDPRYADTDEENGDEGARPRRGRADTIHSATGQKTLRGIRTMFKNEGEDFEEGDTELLIKNPPKKPDFPFLIFPLAVLKDIVDFADLTGIGAIFTTVTSFVIAVILFIWLLGKMQGGWWKKGMIRWLWKRYALAIVIEFIPGLKMIPATTILILMAHFRETKIAQLMNSALERLRHAGIR